MSIREATKARAFRAEEGHLIINAMIEQGWTKKNIALCAGIVEPYVCNVSLDKKNVLNDQELKRLIDLAKREGIEWEQVESLAR